MVILSKSSFSETHFILESKIFTFRFVKTQIDDVLSLEKLITYLVDLRTKVLWPDDDDDSSLPMKNVRHRAFNACLHKIPSKKNS